MYNDVLQYNRVTYSVYNYWHHDPRDPRADGARTRTLLHPFERVLVPFPIGRHTPTQEGVGISLFLFLGHFIGQTDENPKKNDLGSLFAIPTPPLLVQCMYLRRSCGLAMWLGLPRGTHELRSSEFGSKPGRGDDGMRVIQGSASNRTRQVRTYRTFSSP